MISLRLGIRLCPLWAPVLFGIAAAQLPIGTWTDNPHGTLAVVSPPEGPPVTNVPGHWVAVPGLQTQVRSRAGDNLRMRVSAEFSGSHPVWMRARVDGQVVGPDVLMKRIDEGGQTSRSFDFVATNMTTGFHTVTIEWYTNAGQPVQVRDRSLSVSAASATQGTGRLATAVAPSGPDVVKSTAGWEIIPGLQSTIAVDQTSDLHVTVSAEAAADSGRFFVAASVDNYMPADALFDEAGGGHGGTHTMTFTIPGVAAGNHSVRMHWRADNGQIRIGDRTMTVTAVVPNSPGGTLRGGMSQMAPTQLSAAWTPLAIAPATFTVTDASTNIELTFAAELWSTNRIFIRPRLNGQPLRPGDVTLVHRRTQWRTQSFSFVQKNLTPGTYSVTFEAAGDVDGSAWIGDRYVGVLTKRRDGADFGQPFASLAPRQGAPAPILVIGYDSVRPGHVQPTMTQLGNLLRGADGGVSVNGWFNENSQRRFVPGSYTMLGWYYAPPAKRGNYYWTVPNGFTEMWRDAIQAADPAFNFAAYDRNGDGWIQASELTVCVIRPQASPDGYFRSVSANVDGRTLGFDVVDLYVSANTGYRLQNVGTIAHELSHAILGAADMHSTTFTTRPQEYSLMDSHFQATHLDPFHKLKSGFANADTVEINRWTTRTVQLRAVEGTGAITIVYDPAKRDSEYFIVENRSRTTNNFANLDFPIGTAGLVIWHIIEDTNLHTLYPPPGGTGYVGEWGRRGVRKLAVLSAPYQSHALRWANGTATGITVTARGWPGELMTTEFAR